MWPVDAIFATDGQDLRTCNLRFIWGEFHLTTPSFFKPQGGYLSHTHTNFTNFEKTRHTLIHTRCRTHIPSFRRYRHVLSCSFLHLIRRTTHRLTQFLCVFCSNKHPNLKRQWPMPRIFNPSFAIMEPEWSRYE